MTNKHKKEIEELKDKYERTIAELKRNASSDKEFLQNELKKQIADLEKQIRDMKEAFAKEREALMGGQGKIVKEFEDRIQRLKDDHAKAIKSSNDDHRAEIEALK